MLCRLRHHFITSFPIEVSITDNRFRQLPVVPRDDVLMGQKSQDIGDLHRRTSSKIRPHFETKGSEEILD